MSEPRWETIQENANEGRTIITQRLKVYGGWLVRTTYATYSTGTGAGVDQLFIHDQDHKWSLT